MTATWFAVLGHPADGIEFPDRPERAFVLGDFVVEPLEGTFIRHGPSSSFSRMRTSGWAPIRVTGETDHGPNTLREIHRLCGLLSLVLDGAITLLEGPTDVTGIELPEPPRDLHRYAGFEEDAGEEPRRYEQGSLRAVPAWIGEAWRRAAAADLQHAVAIHHEGLMVMQQHPSLARICFVASIEGIGGRKGLKHCPECQQVTGSGRRFRETLSTVFDGELPGELVKGLYGRRSKTAHEGALHGDEPLFRRPFFGLEDASVRVADLSEVWLLRQASRRLLVRELGGSMEGLRGEHITTNKTAKRP